MSENKKRVVIIRSNPIKPDSRVEKESSALYRAGFDVKILAWDRDSNYVERTKELENNSGVQITRLGIKASFGAGINNLRPNLKFQISMLRYLKSHRDDYDIIHACDLDTAFFSYKIANRFHKKFVFDIFDFLFCQPNNLLESVIKHLQIRLINNSDATIICTEQRKKQIKGAKPKKLCVIHNSPPAINFDCDTGYDKHNFTVVYVGILQDDRLLLQIGEYFKEHPDYTFNIAGFGKYEKYFTSLSLECENINYYGRIAYKETLLLESNADIMLAIYEPSVPNHKYAAPNKFYEALMLGKPLIMVKETGMSDEVKNNDLGVLIDYSKDGFADGIDRLLERKNEWLQMSDRMKKIYKEKYSWKKMERRLISLYNEL